MADAEGVVLGNGWERAAIHREGSPEDNGNKWRRAEHEGGELVIYVQHGFGRRLIRAGRLWSWVRWWTTNQALFVISIKYDFAPSPPLPPPLLFYPRGVSRSLTHSLIISFQCTVRNSAGNTHAHARLPCSLIPALPRLLDFIEFLSGSIQSINSIPPPPRNYKSRPSREETIIIGKVIVITFQLQFSKWSLFNYFYSLSSFEGSLESFGALWWV